MSEARELTLHDDLFALRSVIHQFILDKQRAPQSLQEIVEAGYLKEIPKDPITGKPDWQPEFQDLDSQDPAARPEIRNVHSRSTLMGSDGRPYNKW